MSKRQLYPILRESILICLNPLDKFLFLTPSHNHYTMPIFTAEQKETFKTCLMNRMNMLNINFKLEGIMRMEQGQNQFHNYYRCIYYAKTDTVHQSNGFAFKNYKEIDRLNLNQHQRSILTDFNEKKQIFNINFFRQNHIESTPTFQRKSIDVI